MSSLFLLPPISFLAYKYYHYFGSSKGSKARGKHTLVSVVFMHQGVFNSVCPFNCDTQDYHGWFTWEDQSVRKPQ